MVIWKKKKMKVAMQQVVSDIKNCFETLKITLPDKDTEKKNLQRKVREGKTKARGRRQGHHLLNLTRKQQEVVSIYWHPEDSSRSKCVPRELLMIEDLCYLLLLATTEYTELLAENDKKRNELQDALYDTSALIDRIKPTHEKCWNKSRRTQFPSQSLFF